MPQNIGTGGITREALVASEGGWRDWYADVSKGFVLDASSGRWTRCDSADTGLEVSCGTEDLKRSHFDACYIPGAGQIYIFGGSRYFKGE